MTGLQTFTMTLSTIWVGRIAIMIPNVTRVRSNCSLRVYQSSGRSQYVRSVTTNLHLVFYLPKCKGIKTLKNLIHDFGGIVVDN